MMGGVEHDLGRWRDVDVTIVYFDRVPGNIVCPEIEGAARVEVEAGLMPVTGENAVPHGAPVQRKTHVWTVVLDRVNILAVGKYRDTSECARYDDDPALSEFDEGRDADAGTRVQSG